MLWKEKLQNSFQHIFKTIKNHNNFYKLLFNSYFMSLIENPGYNIYFQKPLSAEKVEALLENLVVSLGYDAYVSRQKNMFLNRKNEHPPMLSFLKFIFPSLERKVSRNEVCETIQGYFTVLDEKPPITLSYNLPYNIGYREISLRFVGTIGKKIKDKITIKIEEQSKKFISKNL